VELEPGIWVSHLADDQVRLGGWLTRFQRILITTTDPRHNTLSLPVFGYRVSFTGGEDISGRFKLLVEQGSLRRLWDYELPAAAAQTLWNGYARRQLNAWVPRFGDANQYEAEKYRGVDDAEVIEPGKQANPVAQVL
jgi:CRISPR-associated protein Csm1